MHTCRLAYADILNDRLKV